MFLARYLQSMLPSFSKSRIQSDLNNLKTELSSTTLPPMRTMVDTLTQKKFHADWCNDVDAQFREKSPIKYRGLFLNGLFEILQRMEKNIPLIEGLIDEYYSDNILRDAMTVMQVNILQYLETMTFVTQYSRRLANMVVTIELETLQKVEEYSFTPAEMQWLTRNREDFFTGLNIVSSEKTQLDGIFRKIPEAVVNENNVNTVTASLGSTRADPFGFSLISARLNPIYHIGMLVAEWQTDRINAAKAEKQALEFKLLAYKTLAAEDASKGKAIDIGLQKKINYVQQQVDDLKFKLDKMEANYGAS